MTLTQIESPFVRSGIRQHGGCLSYVQEAGSGPTYDLFELARGSAYLTRATYITKQKVPLNALRRIHVERRAMQRHSDCSDHARPLDADLVDQRTTNDSDEEAADVVETSRKVG